MAKKTIGQMKSEKRDEIMRIVSEALDAAGYDALPYKNNAISTPIALEDGTEDFLQMVFSIPSGSRDGVKFDGYKANEDYEIDKEVKLAKQEELAAKKARDAAEKKAKQEEARKKREAERKAKEAEREKYAGKE